MSQTRVYRVQKLEGASQEHASLAQIDCFRWNVSDVRPEANVRMLRGADCFALSFEATEPELITLARGTNENVYRDSAFEIFLMPAPHIDARYVNLEFNAVGAMYIGVGTGRADNVLLGDEPRRQFCVRTQIEEADEGYHWKLEARIPFAFLARHTAFTNAEADYAMRANFYKIADAAQRPYYASWNPIEWPEPDFHRPEFFGSLVCM